ncbi:MAG TPA: thermostable hemolysin [Gammaproteobacteria bacterium]|nr:thermostable hemolysin [Gammaproteobacteria bacterium]
MSDTLTLSASCMLDSPGITPLVDCSGRLLCEVAPGSDAAAMVTDFIQRRFLQAYGARPELRIPRLLALTTGRGSLLAAVGVRNAGDERLFLEDYIDAPAETLVTCDSPLRRSELAEIAHLAGVEAGVSRFLFAGLTLWLRAQGYRWIAFTGTDQLRNSFKRMGIPMSSIAPADPARLADGGQGWGAYYDHRPVVMTANVETGFQALHQAGLLRRTGWLARSPDREDRYGHIA